jgi:hypothetical protein
MGQDDQVGQGKDAGEMSVFDRLQRQDIRNETRILWCEVAIIAVVALLLIAYIMVS